MATPTTTVERDPLYPNGNRPACLACGEHPVYLTGLCGDCYAAAGRASMDAATYIHEYRTGGTGPRLALDQPAETDAEYAAGVIAGGAGDPYADRVAALEAEGMTTSDAQAVADAQDMGATDLCPSCGGDHDRISRDDCPAPGLHSMGATHYTVRVSYDPDAPVREAWSAAVDGPDGISLILLAGPSAYDVLGEAAVEINRDNGVLAASYIAAELATPDEPGYWAGRP